MPTPTRTRTPTRAATPGQAKPSRLYLAPFGLGGIIIIGSERAGGRVCLRAPQVAARGSYLFGAKLAGVLGGRVLSHRAARLAGQSSGRAAGTGKRLAWRAHSAPTAARSPTAAADTRSPTAAAPSPSTMAGAQLELSLGLRALTALRLAPPPPASQLCMAVPLLLARTRGRQVTAAAAAAAASTLRPLIECYCCCC